MQNKPSRWITVVIHYLGRKQIALSINGANKRWFDVWREGIQNVSSVYSKVDLTTAVSLKTHSRSGSAPVALANAWNAAFEKDTIPTEDPNKCREAVVEKLRSLLNEGVRLDFLTRQLPNEMVASQASASPVITTTTSTPHVGAV